MVRIYRMWRFVRLVERKYGDDTDPNKDSDMTTKRLTAEFHFLRKITGAHYTTAECMKACIMAEKSGYIGYVNPDAKFSKREVAITGDGFKFATYSALVEELSSSLKSFSGILAVIISVIALYVALNTKPPQTVINLEQQDEQETIQETD